MNKTQSGLVGTASALVLAAALAHAYPVFSPPSPNGTNITPLSVTGADINFKSIQRGTNSGAWGSCTAAQDLGVNPASTATHVNLACGSTTGTSGQDKRYATVAGGLLNVASGEGATVAGGENNAMLPDGGIGAGDFGTVGGGQGNMAGFGATVGGGGNSFGLQGNRATGNWSTIPGGLKNTASGNFSFAAGRQSSATAPGAFAMSDSQAADFINSTADSFAARFQGGYSFQGGNAGFGAVNGSPFDAVTLGVTRFLGWDYTTGQPASRRWEARTDIVVYGDWALRTESAQGGGINTTRIYVDPNGAASFGTTNPSTFTANGSLQVPYNVSAGSANFSGSTPSAYALNAVNTSPTPGTSFGANIRGGSNASDLALRVQNYNATSDFLQLRGDGEWVVGCVPSATLRAIAPNTHSPGSGIITTVYNCTDFDIYTSTGVGIDQWRNTRTGLGP